MMADVKITNKKVKRITGDAYCYLNIPLMTDYRNSTISWKLKILER